MRSTRALPQPAGSAKGKPGFFPKRIIGGGTTQRVPGLNTRGNQTPLAETRRSEASPRSGSRLPPQPGGRGGEAEAAPWLPGAFPEPAGRAAGRPGPGLSKNRGLQ